MKSQMKLPEQRTLVNSFQYGAEGAFKDFDPSTN